MQTTNNSQRLNQLQNSSQSSRRARIFDTGCQSSERRNTPSIIPISNSKVDKSPVIQTEEFYVNGLQQSQVSELQLNDFNKVNQFQKLPDLSRCKVKFIKKENQSTQTDSDQKDEIIKQQEILIRQLQEQLQQVKQQSMEFSFYKENQDQQILSPKYNSIQQNQDQQILSPKYNSLQLNQESNQLMTNSPYRKQQKQQTNQYYFTVIPQSDQKSFILKPNNQVKVIEEYTKQRSNKDYFFSLKD